MAIPMHCRIFSGVSFSSVINDGRLAARPDNTNTNIGRNEKKFANHAHVCLLLIYLARPCLRNYLEIWAPCLNVMINRFNQPITL